jgi:oxygen-independent coproporphyrinogen-3 oxidase
MLEIEDKGRALIATHHFQRYEISAYAKSGAKSEHNLNYWRYGDYYGIGAGAHGKITHQAGHVIRSSKLRQPISYLKAEKSFLAEETQIDSPNVLMFEFMLNQARLLEPIAFEHFETRTNLKRIGLIEKLKEAQALQLVDVDDTTFQLTPKGIRFSNELVQLFLD